MPQKKKRESKVNGLEALARTHLEIGDGKTTTHQSLVNHLENQGYEIDKVDSEVQNYFSAQETGLKQTYELEKEGETYRLTVEKEGGRMQKYWFEE